MNEWKYIEVKWIPAYLVFSALLAPVFLPCCFSQPWLPRVSQTHTTSFLFSKPWSQVPPEHPAELAGALTYFFLLRVEHFFLATSLLLARCHIRCTVDILFHAIGDQSEDSVLWILVELSLRDGVLSLFFVQKVLCCPCLPQPPSLPSLTTL